MQDPLADEFTDEFTDASKQKPIAGARLMLRCVQLSVLCVFPDRDNLLTQSQPDSTRSAEADLLHDRITEKLQRLTRACTPPPHLPSVEDGGELFPKGPSAADVRRPSAPSAV